MIDWNRVSELREEVGEADFGEVLDMFFEEVAAVLEELGSGSTDATKSELHFLKGSAMNIGMSDVSSLCREFETALAADPKEVVDIDAIRQAFLASKEAIASAQTRR